MSQEGTKRTMNSPLSIVLSQTADELCSLAIPLYKEINKTTHNNRLVLKTINSYTVEYLHAKKKTF